MDNESKAELSSIVSPSFESLVSSVYSAILLNLGEIKVKGAGEVSENLEIAKFNIGLLKMLEEKTKGNLTEEEDSYLHGVILNSMEKLREHSL
ncbi:DUF1844 domain-containing protein [bacterium]|jgi:Domain of unknown function (DUF1844).|nr:DUF1844 domain-containing protein [bacterium]MBQ4438590.1 DUF1844 domain-containing protein [bacterium]